MHDLLYRVHLLCNAVGTTEFLCVWVSRCELPGVAAYDSTALPSTTWGVIGVQRGETPPYLFFVFNWLLKGNLDWLLMVMRLQIFLLCLEMLLLLGKEALTHGRPPLTEDPIELCEASPVVNHGDLLISI